MNEFFYYTFLDGKLMGSENPEFSGNPREILEYCHDTLGFRHLINLTLQDGSYKINGLQAHHIPVENMPSISQMKEVERITDEALSNNEPVWIHCQKGIDRTAAVIGRYLISRGLDRDDIINQLERRIKDRVNYPNFNTYWKDTRVFIGQASLKYSDTIPGRCR